MTSHLKEVCKIGQGTECCRFLIASSAGFECAKNIPGMEDYLREHWGDIPRHSHGDNCEGVPNSLLNDKIG